MYSSLECGIGSFDDADHVVGAGVRRLGGQAQRHGFRRAQLEGRPIAACGVGAEERVSARPFSLQQRLQRRLRQRHVRQRLLRVGPANGRIQIARCRRSRRHAVESGKMLRRGNHEQAERAAASRFLRRRHVVGAGSTEHFAGNALRQVVRRVNQQPLAAHVDRSVRIEAELRRADPGADVDDAARRRAGREETGQDEVGSVRERPVAHPQVRFLRNERRTRDDVALAVPPASPMGVTPACRSACSTYAAAASCPGDGVARPASSSEARNVMSRSRSAARIESAAARRVNRGGAWPDRPATSARIAASVTDPVRSRRAPAAGMAGAVSLRQLTDPPCGGNFFPQKLNIRRGRPTHSRYGRRQRDARRVDRENRPGRSGRVRAAVPAVPAGRVSVRRAHVRIGGAG